MKEVYRSQCAAVPMQLSKHCHLRVLFLVCILNHTCCMMHQMGACKSDWMTKERFVEVFIQFFKFMNASKSHPILLEMNNHKSHLSVALVNEACLV